jgi:hypothetical protein
MAKPQIKKLLTGLAGEFFVAGELSKKGYVASLTLKNYPGVDIFCYNPENSRQISIQVKTIRGGSRYYISDTVDAYNIPFVFVYIDSTESVKYYVVSSKKVAQLSKEEHDEYLKNHPNVSRKQPRMLSISKLNSFKDRWDELGLEGEKI